MSGDEDVPASEQLGRDGTIPVGRDPIERRFQGFGRGKVCWCKSRIPWIEPRVAGVVIAQGRRRDVVAPAPDLDLIRAVLPGRRSFVETL